LSYAQNQKTQQLYEVAQQLLATDPRETGPIFWNRFGARLAFERHACLTRRAANCMWRESLIATRAENP